MANDQLSGQIALITGASRGVGRALVLDLRSRGAAVAAVARASEDLASLRREGILALDADVRSDDQMQAAFTAVTDELGAPTLVVTCAGTASVLGPAWSADPGAWWDAVAVDLLGTMITARAAVRRMLPARAGRIVTVYGNLGDTQTANVSAFAAAKAGVARFTESLACELEGTGVRVFAMHPGFVRTPMTEQLAWSEPARNWLPDFGPGAEQRWGDAAAAQALLAAIAAGEADELTGRLLWAGDDLGEVARRCRSDPDARRLRLIR